MRRGGEGGSAGGMGVSKVWRDGNILHISIILRSTIFTTIVCNVTVVIIIAITISTSAVTIIIITIFDNSQEPMA